MWAILSLSLSPCIIITRRVEEKSGNLQQKLDGGSDSRVGSVLGAVRWRVGIVSVLIQCMPYLLVVDFVSITVVKINSLQPNLFLFWIFDHSNKDETGLSLNAFHSKFLWWSGHIFLFIMMLVAFPCFISYLMMCFVKCLVMCFAHLYSKSWT
jgi:hypothetical protein